MSGWASMLASRTAERGWEAAVGSTFSGDDPCAMCTAASTMKRIEQGGPAKGDPAPSPSKQLKKIDAPAPDLLIESGTTDVCAAALLYPGVIDLVPQSPPQLEPPPPRRA
jgi:hypothetical protein